MLVEGNEFVGLRWNDLEKSGEEWSAIDEFVGMLGARGWDLGGKLWSV